MSVCTRRMAVDAGLGGSQRSGARDAPGRPGIADQQPSIAGVGIVDFADNRSPAAGRSGRDSEVVEDGRCRSRRSDCRAGVWPSAAKAQVKAQEDARIAAPIIDLLIPEIHSASPWRRPLISSRSILHV